MTSATLDDVNKKVLALEKEMQELRAAVQASNRHELAQAAKDARAGRGKWHTLPSK